MRINLNMIIGKREITVYANDRNKTVIRTIRDNHPCFYYLVNLCHVTCKKENTMFEVYYEYISKKIEFITLVIEDANTKEIIFKTRGSEAKENFSILTGKGNDTSMIPIESIEFDKNECCNRENEKKEPLTGFDPVSNPSHYTEGRKYEPRKVIEDWGLNFYLGNALKYISRAGRKGNAKEDLEKAKKYIAFEIERLEKSSSSHQIHDL